MFKDLSVRSCAESVCAQCACTSNTHSQHKISHSSPYKYFLVLRLQVVLLLSLCILPLTRKGRKSNYGKNMRSVCCVFLGIIGILSQVQNHISESM